MRFLFFITVAVVFAYPAKGQTCSCESNFEWVKKTFEENDAGFSYIIEKKGQRAYNIHNQLTIEKIKSVSNTKECLQLLSDWLKFFRTGHIGISALTNETSNLQENWNIDIPQFEKYISEKIEVDFEGIWKQNETSKTRFGIKREGENYVVFVIDDTKTKIITIEKNGEELNTIYYARYTSPYKIPNPVLIGNNTLQFGEWGTWKRVSPTFPEDTENIASEKDYEKFLTATNPYLEELNATTLYLRIPSFGIENKAAIDKLISDSKVKILKTENLIIDLRNNGGGRDQSFTELLPLIYTNPVRTISVEFLSTVQNNQLFLEYSADTDLDEDTRRWAKKVYDKLQENLGKFVNVFDEDVSIFTQDTVYEYPKNVGIIINEGNASTTEQFILAAKQSKKVKLFGTTTWGALDISNMASIESPCKEFNLAYCLSRSMRIPGMAIDDIGLQPDFYLDKTIPQRKWVEYVSEILKQ